MAAEVTGRGGAVFQVLIPLAVKNVRPRHIQLSNSSFMLLSYLDLHGVSNACLLCVENAICGSRIY